MKRPPRRTDQIAPLIAPAVRFLWGLGLILVLVLSPSWVCKTGLCLMAAGLTALAGKRVQFAYFLFLLATVIFFQLLLPLGKVLVQVGPFVVTDGALRDGYDRGITLCGLVFISLFSVSRELRLPGAFGRLWAQAFSFYEQLLEARKTLRPRNLLLSIDAILENHYPTKGISSGETHLPHNPRRTTLGGGLLMVSTGLGAGLFWWLGGVVP